MVNISSEHKTNFTFYCMFVLIGIVGALSLYVISITLAIPFLMFFAIGCLASGLITAELLRRAEKENSEHKQTHYMKNLARRWHGNRLKEAKKAMGIQKGSLMDNIIKDKVKKEPEEEIPPVEILPEEEEKKVETIGELE